jgi:hypothetical protein
MKRWAKEDRYSWENSEVMKEFESKILSNYSFLEKAALQNIDQKTLSVENLNEKIKETTTALTNLNKLSTSAADDGMSEKECQCNNAEDCMICRKPEEDYSDDEVKFAKEEILSHLRKMANDAIGSGNIKLAYKIERTISEVEED